MAKNKSDSETSPDEDIRSSIEKAIGRRVRAKKLKINLVQAKAILEVSGDYQFYNDLRKSDLQDLSINLLTDNEIFPPVILDEKDRLLDGHQRLKAFVQRAETTDQTRLKMPAMKITGLCEEEKIWIVRSLNDNRRHLGSEARKKSITKALEKFNLEGINPSDRSVARILAVNHKTVAKYRENTNQPEEEKRLGIDGRYQKKKQTSSEWDRISKEYKSLEKWHVSLLIDDITESSKARQTVAALGKLGSLIIRKGHGFLLLYCRPEQVGEAARALPTRYTFRYQWPLLIPKEHWNHSLQNFQPMTRYFVLFSVGEMWEKLCERDRVFDYRKRQGRTIDDLRDEALYELLKGPLKMPHVHSRCTPTGLQRSWVTKDNFDIYDRNKELIKGSS